MTIAILGFVLLLLLILPYFAPAHVNRSYYSCRANLQRVALGLRIWANDHGERFPWQVPQREGGTLEYAGSAAVWRHFQAASNGITTPSVLACSYDTSRRRATDWSRLRNKNISYFISMDIDASHPSRILAGDRLLSTNNKAIFGLLITTNSSTLRWVSSPHPDAGLVAQTDGSVVRLSTAGLREAFSNRTAHFALP